METLQVALVISGILVAVSYLVTLGLGNLFLQNKRLSNILVLILGMATLAIAVAYSILYGWNAFLVIAVCCWVPSLIMTAVELAKTKPNGN